MSEVSNWQKTKNLATGIWNSIGGSRYYETELLRTSDIANSVMEIARKKIGTVGGLTQDEFDKIAPTYKNSLMDSIRTNKNPFHTNTAIGILAGTTAAVGYSYANDDMDNYKRNVAVGGLSGGLVGHLDKVLSGAIKSQGKLTKESEKNSFTENDFSDFLDDFLD